MAQAGTQVCLVIAIVLSVCVHVRVCVFVCLHVAQCVYRASAWEDKRRSTMHLRQQSRLILVCAYSTYLHREPVCEASR